VVRQVVTDGSGGTAQFIERRTSNQNAARPWFDSQYGSVSQCP